MKLTELEERKINNKLTKLEERLFSFIGKTHEELAKELFKLKEFGVKKIKPVQNKNVKFYIYTSEEHGYIVILSSKGYEQCEEIEEF